MPFKKKNQTFITVFSVLMVIVMLFFSARIYHLQFKSDEFADQTDGAAAVLVATLKAPRGESLDRYGSF